ncbi:MAG TPA: hypothetical protein VIR60_04950 [Gammaproteobacteria bacterium]
MIPSWLKRCVSALLLACVTLTSFPATAELEAIWAGGRKGIMKLDPATADVLLRTADRKDIVAIAVDAPRSRVWALSKHAVLYRFDTDGQQLSSTDLVLGHHDEPSVEYSALQVMPADGSVWVGSRRVLIKFAADGTRLFTVNLVRRVRALAVDEARNELWVATDRSLERYNAQGTKTRSVDLPHHPNIEDIAFDPVKQQLWMADKYSLARFSAEGVLLNEASLRRIERLDVGSDGSVWAATEHQLYRFDWQAGNKTAIHTGFELDIEDIHVDRVTGDVWVHDQRQLVHINAAGTVVSRFTGIKHIDVMALAYIADAVAPAVQIVAPANDALVGPQPSVELGFSDDASGVDPASIAFTVNGTLTAFTCTPTATAATCAPDAPLTAPVLDVSLTVADYAGNVSAPATAHWLLDSDGDTVADQDDLYPQDPGRHRLAAVTGIAPALEGTQVRIDWTALEDSANTAGYLVYRMPPATDEAQLLTATPVTGTSYLDNTAANGSGYRYRIVARDIHGRDGDPSEPVPFMVAYNLTSTAGFTAVRQGVPVHLSWNAVAGVRYQIFRATLAEGAPWEPLSLVDTLSYVDAAVDPASGYRYQLATVAEFINPFTGAAVSVLGPPSAVQTIERDTVAPVLTLIAPADGALIPAQPDLQIDIAETGVGADLASAQLLVNGVATAITCTGNATNTVCSPSAPLTVVDMQLALTLADLAGNVSAPVTVHVLLDTDQDGHTDADDAFPTDPSEWADLDGDGTGDNADTDRDGDGFSNDIELQVGTDPNNAADAPADLDGDFLPDTLDDDRDGDSVPNADDVFPDDPAESADLDGDGTGDNADTDRDGDGFDNDTETQLGTDPGNPGDAPPDLDGDFIPDALDDDRDGDGAANGDDLYPDDAARQRLAAVAGTTPALDGTHVRIDWQPAADTPNVAGYNVYRLPADADTPVQLNSGPVDALSFVDESVLNGTGYRYRVTAVDRQGREGDSSAAVPVFVAYNVTGISNLLADRAGVPVDLSWDQAAGFEYQLYRGVAGTTPAELAQVTSAQYQDGDVVWQSDYTYQVATVASFTDPFTGAALRLTGPRSAPVAVAALPQLALTIDGGVAAADGALEITLSGQPSVTLAGQYLHALGAVDIEATDGTRQLSATADDGALRMVLPVTGTATWTVRVTEQTYADRTVTATVRLLADTAAPSLSIDGDAQRSIDADSIRITGAASDARSGIAAVTVRSDRYAGQSFGALLGDAHSFAAEIPLETGNNILTVSAVDGAGNVATAQVTVERSVDLAPVLNIQSPANGAQVGSDTLTLNGVVYTGLPPEQVIIALGDRQQFATAGAQAGVYPFSFENVRLQDGLNNLTVRVRTPAGEAQSSVFVTYTTDPQETELPAPVISLTAPLNTYVSGSSVTVAGSVTSYAGAVVLTINGAPVALSGSGSSQGNFQYPVDLSAVTDTVTLTLVAQDVRGVSTTRTLTLRHDTTAPVIAVTSPGAQPAPAVTTVVEAPYHLSGSVSDADLTGVSVNGQNVGLLPGGQAGSYAFDVALTLPPGVDQPVSIEAWDRAGNRASYELILRADVAVGIEIISPLDGATLNAAGASYVLDAVARLTGLGAEHRVEISANGAAGQAMAINGNVATASLTLDAGEEDQQLRVRVLNAADTVVAERRVDVTVIDQSAVPLELLRTEPANAQTGVEPNAFLAVYFNKPIVPADLQIAVRETVHGETYDLSAQQGSNPTLDGNTARIVRVDHDQQVVNGGLSVFPGSRTVAYYPERDFAYGATVFVDVTYAGEALGRFSYQVRPLPTLVQGFVADSLMQPVPGIEVSLPALGRTAITDSQGNYSFGFGDSADNALPGGRQRLVINPGLKDRGFGTLEQWANLETGRLTQLELAIVPILNAEEPFRRIAGGQAQAVLAANDLTLGLGNASLVFPDGSRSGDVHVQMLPRHLVQVSALPSVAPHWLFAVQPAGIKVTGGFTATLDMPALYGSYDYIPEDGTRVLMVGFDATTKQLVPIGIGRIENRQVISIGALQAGNLDYLGYVMKDAEAQGVIERYENGQIGFQQMLAELDRLAQ